VQAERLHDVGVVQRAVHDLDAADLDWVQVRERRDAAGRADGDLDRAQQTGRFVRRELECELPAGRARGRAEALAIIEPIELRDDAVDFERQVGALLADLAW
jgi:hypothetical protein